MRIDVVFDTVCPWCYVGKRRLERALFGRPALKVELRWQPFLLNPDMPEGGIERRAYLERKFGGGHRVQQMFGAIVAAGQAEDIPFAFDKIDRAPDSVASHRLIRYAGRFGHDAAAVEAVFNAYFVKGRDIGDLDVLVAIGDGLGIEPDGLRAYLKSDEDVATIHADNTRAHRLGVSGVPSYLFDGVFALAGAQETDIFLRLLDLTRENEAALPVS
ncbi:MAG: DsbA family oxidoreductase [Rhodospirillales bacterium]|nr:DsbA family oxidoreductase [Rhodospirillales bacterium]